MINKFTFSPWAYLLLLFPVVSAILALNHFGFLFKSGTAGTGILILWLLFRPKLPQAKDILMLMAAFVFSIAGDWYLSNRQGNSNMFVAGIVFFFFAHAGYLYYALVNGKVKWKLTAVLLSAYLAFFFLKLFPSFTNMALMWAALVYLVISCFSLGAATGLQGDPVSKVAYIFGIFLILLSDTIIAFKEFAGYKELNFLILPTYYFAHIAIVFSLIRRHLTEPETKKQKGGI